MQRPRVALSQPSALFRKQRSGTHIPENRPFGAPSEPHARG